MSNAPMFSNIYSTKLNLSSNRKTCWIKLKTSKYWGRLLVLKRTIGSTKRGSFKVRRNSLFKNSQSSGPRWVTVLGLSSCTRTRRDGNWSKDWISKRQLTANSLDGYDLLWNVYCFNDQLNLVRPLPHLELPIILFRKFLDRRVDSPPLLNYLGHFI